MTWCISTTVTTMWNIWNANLTEFLSLELDNVNTLCNQFLLNRSNSTVNLLEETVENVETTNADAESYNNKEVGDTMENCFETALQISSATVDTPVLKETESKIQGLDLNTSLPSSSEESSLDSSTSDSSINEIQCICNISIKFAHIDFVMCSECSYLQHAPCMGYLHFSDIDNYVCHKCKFGANLSPEEEKRKQLRSIYRLAVAEAYFRKKVPQDVLNQLEDKEKRLILKRLKAFGIISAKDGQVNVKHIETTCLKGLFQIDSFAEVKEPVSMTLEDSDKYEENSFVFDSVSYKKRKYM